MYHLLVVFNEMISHKTGESYPQNRGRFQTIEGMGTGAPLEVGRILVNGGRGIFQDPQIVPVLVEAEDGNFSQDIMVLPPMADYD